MLTLELALEEVQKMVKVDENKLEELGQILFELRGKTRVRIHPLGTRVLCLRDNPAQQWSNLQQSVMDGLRNEN